MAASPHRRPTTGAIVLFVAVLLFVSYLQFSANNRADHAEDTLKTTVSRVNHLTEVNHNLVTSLQSAIVESCRENGNARAKVQREQLHEEIQKTKHPDQETIAALHLPPELVERLTRENLQTLRDRLSRVKLTPCAIQYQISPGSGERRRDRNSG